MTKACRVSASPTYRIREVDGHDDDIAETIRDLHALTFWRSAPPVNTEVGHWWLAFRGDEPVAFAGMCMCDREKNAVYFERVGVSPKHRGHGLQLRFMRAIEARARRDGLSMVVTDTASNNSPSANNMIRRGYEIFMPKDPWGLASAIYWRKRL